LRKSPKWLEKIKGRTITKNPKNSSPGPITFKFERGGMKETKSGVPSRGGLCLERAILLSGGVSLMMLKKGRGVTGGEVHFVPGGRVLSFMSRSARRGETARRLPGTGEASKYASYRGRGKV